MKKMILVFIIIFGIFFITGCEKKEDKKIEQKVISSMICTMTEEKDEETKEYSIELFFENGVLTTKKDVLTWKNSKTETCDFYKKREEVYNKMAGIRDSVQCSGTEGTRTTNYTFAELDSSEIRLAESRYVREDQSFDYDSYKTYRQNEGYHCIVQ